LLKLGICMGRKSLIQTLPEWVGKAPLNLVYAFLAGIIDGDGCVSKNNTGNRIITACFDFAQKITALLNSLGISCSYGKPIFDNRKRIIFSKNPVYHVRFSAINEQISKHIVHPKKLIRSQITPVGQRKSRSVKSIERIKYNGWFYDFTVKKYHNYIANGHFVSNTHVAGIIAANDDHQGMVGIAPKAKIMPLKVLNSLGMGSVDNIAEAIFYAVDNNADIITMSLGARNPVPKVLDAINYANSKSVPCFVAAGNAGSSKNLLYPAAYTECISIGAVDENCMRADFSCTGPNLDFVAPGVKIYSTVPKNSYAYLSGTSMACPFAVGVAALVLSQKREYEPNLKLNIDDYRQILKSNTLSIKNLDLNLDQQGTRFWQGMGIINPNEFEEWVQYRAAEEIKTKIIKIKDEIYALKNPKLKEDIKKFIDLIKSE